MAGYNLTTQRLGVADAEVVREAKRIFRHLVQPNAHLAAVSADWFALHHGVRQQRRVQKIAASIIERFHRNGWLSRGEGRSYVLSDAGKGWLARAECASGDPFLAQHQLRVVRTIVDPSGRTQHVEINQNEDPLSYLLSRRVISRVQYTAGERLRLDYTFARIGPRLVVDLEAPVVQTSKVPGAGLPERAIAAGQRFRAALRAVGPGLCDLLFDVCCDLKGLQVAEREREWPRRSAKVVLGLALDRLATHYGMVTTGACRSPIRGWRVPDDEEEAPEPLRN